MAAQHQSKRGGIRPGAGRPKGTSRLYAFRANDKLSKYIDSQDNKTDFIKNCIIKEIESTQDSAQHTAHNLAQDSAYDSALHTTQDSAQHTAQDSAYDSAQHTTQDSAQHTAQHTIIPVSQVKPFTLPFFDIQLVAGFPIPLNSDEMAQDIELLKMLCPHPDSSYLIRVKGESMIDAGINDGDILIVDKSQRQPTEKQVAVCELNGEYTVKRVVEKDGKRWLIPANPSYPNFEITDGDFFSVWGVVTYVIHKPVY